MSVTQLEMRLAPATLVSPTLVTYLNEHFQVVDVQVSQPVFNATTINQVFTFNSGSVNGSNASKQQLQLLDLTQLTNPSAASGATLTIKVISGSPDVEVGFIKATGIALGAVTVQGNLGGIDAGDGVTTPGLASLSVQTMGAYGTTTQAPGSLESDVLGPLGVLTVVGNIDGAFINVSGGSAGTIGQVNVGGSLVGGAADYSGEISASGDVGDVGGVTVGGSLDGGAGFGTGAILPGGNLGPVKIGGGVVGSGGACSGSIFAAGNVAGVTVGGALSSGAGDVSGAIVANGNMGQVTIGKGVQGAAGLCSGSILAGGTLAGVTVGGALSGGPGEYSGEIVDSGDLGPVKITGNLQGAGGEFSGEVGSLLGNVAGVTVDGSVGGGAGGSSGEIFADMGTLGPVTITGNLLGGSVSGRQSLANSGYIFGERITSVSITGSVIAGQNTGKGKLTNSGAIRATYDIGAVKVGSLMGNKTNPVVISARGQNPATLPANSTTDVAIASITVTGSVSFTNILAGYNPAGVGVNAAAQIGPVSVGGSWTASNLVAGAAPGLDGQFGTADDVVLVPSDATDAISQIGAIVIKGTVFGNVNNSAAYYGFVAQEVTSLTVAGKVIKLTPGPNNDHLVSLDSTGTVTVNEV